MTGLGLRRVVNRCLHTTTWTLCDVSLATNLCGCSGAHSPDGASFSRNGTDPGLLWKLL